MKGISRLLKISQDADPYFNPIWAIHNRMTFHNIINSKDGFILSDNRGNVSQDVGAGLMDEINKNSSEGITIAKGSLRDTMRLKFIINI